MTYEIIKSNGDNLLYLTDGLIDRTHSSLTFIGKNISNYGEIQNNNFLHLLENFSSENEPSNPLKGQIWFDTANQTLKFFNNNASWQSISAATCSPTSDLAVGAGALWFNSDTGQLLVNNGSGFTTIGPQYILGFGVTRLLSISIKDNADVLHPVIEIVIDDEIIAIIAHDGFIISNSYPIDGFSSVIPGINFKNADSRNFQLAGNSQTASKADQLRNQDGTAFISAFTTATANSIVQRDAYGDTEVNKLKAVEINTVEGTLSGKWIINNNFKPISDATINLGQSAARWNNVYSKTITAGTVNATTSTFTQLTDSLGNTIVKIDNDHTLSANSDQNLGTQKAVKSYIDTMIAAEVSARVSAELNLQSQINGLQFIPVGTVLYTAGTILPVGYLEANGQSVNKSSYSALYNALGGIDSPYGQTGTTFNVPDLRGEFIRGWDHGRGVDSGRSFGSSQSDDFKSHHHTYTRYASKQVQTGSSTPCWYGDTTVNTSDVGGNETRPRNVALYPIIKY